MGVGDDKDVHIVLQKLEFNVTIGIQTFGWHAGQMAYERCSKGLGPFLEFHDQLVADSIRIHHEGCRGGLERIQSRHQRSCRELSSLWKHPKLVLLQGQTLHVYMYYSCRMNLPEPWFSLLKVGQKRTYATVHTDKRLGKGDIITFHNNEMGWPRVCSAKITSVHFYPSFEACIQKEGLDRALPGVDTIEEGLRVYRAHYSKADEEKYQVVAYRLRVA